MPLGLTKEEIFLMPPAEQEAFARMTLDAAKQQRALLKRAKSSPLANGLLRLVPIAVAFLYWLRPNLQWSLPYAIFGLTLFVSIYFAMANRRMNALLELMQKKEL